jgi:hypothetical protein
MTSQRVNTTHQSLQGLAAFVHAAAVKPLGLCTGLAGSFGSARLRRLDLTAMDQVHPGEGSA